MSNTELYYEQLTDLSIQIAAGIKNRTQPLDELIQALTQLSQTNAIKGNAADAMKAYISEVHMTLIQTLELLLNNYEMALGKYVKGYLEVDSSESFKLVKEDFDDHERKLSSHRSDFTSFGNQLKAISDEAEDIISLSGAGSKSIFNVVSEMDAMKKTVSDLEENWNSYEQKDPGFNQVQELIAQTKALLKSTLSVPRGYSYSPGSFSKLMSKNFVDAFIANANYAQNPDNQKAFQDDWKSISKNYTADQKRMAEEAKEKAQKEGLIGLIWDGLQICAGTVLVVTGVGTGFGVVLIAGGINSAINHASMAATGKSFNMVGNLTNGAVQWYNKNIGEPLVKTGNPIAKFVAGLGNGAIEVAGGMGQFSVYDTGKTVYTLATNSQARAQFGAGVGNWWNQIRSGDVYVIGQTTATVASLFVGGEDIGVAVSKASKAESLLGKIGTFSKSVAVSSAENVKSLLPKVTDALSDVGTASVTFAKTFGKTFAEESGKYANACFDVLGALGAGVKITCKANIAGAKEVKSVLRMVKAQENGAVKLKDDGTIEVNFNINPKAKYGPSEFNRQLGKQEAGMNDLTIKEFLDNRKAFKVNGRTKEAAISQKQIRQDAIKIKTNQLRESGLSKAEAQKQAEQWVKGQDALHNPDMIAGGKADGISGLGDKRVNRAIGSQWRCRVDAIDDCVNKVSQGMSEEQKVNAKLNIKLVGVIK